MRGSIAGPRHAAIGLDYIEADSMARYIRANAEFYGGGNQYPADGYIDFAPPSVFPQVTDELLRRGYSDEDVSGILGANYLRVLEANL